ncbi:hypothetical protein F2P81_019041 [Scophthalmus maximus]|uniref:Uncharacterized protein n=1 Tax=Scophthalmus maximus TaxID=52904 RepID=A0A6A4S3Z2_SCOMX|nr:hypothetical protein F2P81_019041 [Scophthalmus maximus]
MSDESCAVERDPVEKQAALRQQNLLTLVSLCGCFRSPELLPFPLWTPGVILRRSTEENLHISHTIAAEILLRAFPVVVLVTKTLVSSAAANFHREVLCKVFYPELGSSRFRRVDPCGKSGWFSTCKRLHVHLFIAPSHADRGEECVTCGESSTQNPGRVVVSGD